MPCTRRWPAVRPPCPSKSYMPPRARGTTIATYDKRIALGEATSCALAKRAALPPRASVGSGARRRARSRDGGAAAAKILGSKSASAARGRERERTGESQENSAEFDRALSLRSKINLGTRACERWCGPRHAPPTRARAADRAAVHTSVTGHRRPRVRERVRSDVRPACEKEQCGNQNGARTHSCHSSSGVKAIHGAAFARVPAGRGSRARSRTRRANASARGSHSTSRSASSTAHRRSRAST